MTGRSASSLIAFQGKEGAWSHAACLNAYPDKTPLPCPTFADAFKAVESGRAERAMIPIDNSIAGRVADIHHLLPDTRLRIVAEHFIPIHHCLLGVAGAKLQTIKTVYSHVHALPQCRRFIAEHGLKAVVFEDTAGSAQKVAEMNNPAHAAIASEQAAQLYGLKVLKRNIEDMAGNTTRFIVLAKQENPPRMVKGESYLTSLLFNVRNIPAALYKALGGFATNGVNIMKLESYLEGSRFHSAFFYCECEAHPAETRFQNALEELQFYSTNIKMLGTYAAHPFRRR